MRGLPAGRIHHQVLLLKAKQRKYFVLLCFLLLSNAIFDLVHIRWTPVVQAAIPVGKEEEKEEVEGSSLKDKEVEGSPMKKRKVFFKIDKS